MRSSIAGHEKRRQGGRVHRSAGSTPATAGFPTPGRRTSPPFTKNLGLTPALENVFDTEGHQALCRRERECHAPKIPAAKRIQAGCVAPGLVRQGSLNQALKKLLLAGSIICSADGMPALGAYRFSPPIHYRNKTLHTCEVYCYTGCMGMMGKANAGSRFFSFSRPPGLVNFVP